MRTIRIILLSFLVLQAGWVWGQSRQMQTFPALELGGDQGGTPAGVTWRSEALMGRPAVIALVNPDYQNRLSPIEEAIEQESVPASSAHFIKILDTRSSWKPDKVIQAGVWWDKMTTTFDEARNDGIVQALFVSRSRKKAEWAIIYDRDAITRRAMQLDQEPVYLFLLDAQGRVIDQFKGTPTGKMARSWVLRIKQKGNS